MQKSVLILSRAVYVHISYPNTNLDFLRLSFLQFPAFRKKFVSRDKSTVNFCLSVENAEFFTLGNPNLSKYPLLPKNV